MPEFSSSKSRFDLDFKDLPEKTPLGV